MQWPTMASFMWYSDNVNHCPWRKRRGLLLYLEVEAVPKGGGKIDTARAEYIRRRTNGEKVNLRELAEQMGLSYSYVRNRKRDEQWDDDLPPRKRGGQPGNQNSKGKRNAAGSHKGAPPGNKNAEKDGAYSAVFFDMLSDEEKEFVEKAPVGSREALEHEMKILKFREHKILSKIAEYEAAPQDALYVSSVLDMRKPGGRGNQKKDGVNQEIGMYNKDSAFSRVLKLQEALYKVQGRIAKVADSLRMIEEFGVKIELERERLEILRVRATGMVDAPDGEDGPDDLGEIKLEDVTGNSDV